MASKIMHRGVRSFQKTNRNTNLLISSTVLRLEAKGYVENTSNKMPNGKFVCKIEGLNEDAYKNLVSLRKMKKSIRNLLHKSVMVADSYLNLRKPLEPSNQLVELSKYAQRTCIKQVYKREIRKRLPDLLFARRADEHKPKIYAYSGDLIGLRAYSGDGWQKFWPKYENGQLFGYDN